MLSIFNGFKLQFNKCVKTANRYDINQLYHGQLLITVKNEIMKRDCLTESKTHCVNLKYQTNTIQY